MPEYVWNFDREEEIWREAIHDSIEACMEEAEKENKYDGRAHEFVYIGEAITFVPKVYGTDVLEWIAEQAYDECGEVAEDWDSYDIKEKEQLEELDRKLNRVVQDWLVKYNYWPKFWKIENIKEYELKSYRRKEGGC